MAKPNAGPLAAEPVVPVGPAPLPPCRPKYSAAKALYVEPNVPPTGPGKFRLRVERVFIRDGRWMVRRKGRLVPLAFERPVPDALKLQGGTVENGLGGWWPDLASFARANGIEPSHLEMT